MQLQGSRSCASALPAHRVAVSIATHCQRKTHGVTSCSIHAKMASGMAEYQKLGLLPKDVLTSFNENDLPQET
ncbi:hypothetical protein [Burkholderia sp. MSMB1589WGS]|uniref:hypothetical protein n=1 Tax=Burkholderia sp. MSMB1589WGS TaxID=1636425 RepID=UPI0012E8A992|nr:hypothetical protein [Burkholderia sp. MSMB1589WGS]